MSLTARRWQNLDGSLVANTAEHAERLRSQGREIFDLTSGEPDFDTPSNAQAEAHRAIEQGDTKYTATDGSATMKEAVRFKLARDNGLDYPAGRHLYWLGGKVTGVSCVAGPARSR